MNNTKQAAQAAIDRATVILADRYDHDGHGYRGGPMHEVNVKRYYDYINETDTRAIAARAATAHSMGSKEQAAVLEHVKKYTENVDAYNYEFLSTAWDYLNYGAGDKDIVGREYKHIHQHAYPVRNDSDKRHNTMIVARGRSGGHACFQSDVEMLCDNLADMLEYEQYTAKELRDATKELDDACDEVEHLQAFIKEYNKNLSWAEHVEFRADEYSAELRADIDKNTERRKAQIQHNAPLLSR